MATSRRHPRGPADLPAGSREACAPTTLDLTDVPERLAHLDLWELSPLNGQSYSGFLSIPAVRRRIERTCAAHEVPMHAAMATEAGEDHRHLIVITSPRCGESSHS
jgi:hypothetical protein